jgi:hypothetical protein
MFGGAGEFTLGLRDRRGVPADLRMPVRAWRCTLNSQLQAL